MSFSLHHGTQAAQLTSREIKPTGHFSNGEVFLKPVSPKRKLYAIPSTQNILLDGCIL